MKPRNIKDLHHQSRDLSVRPIAKDMFVVESRSNPRGQHVVTVRFSGDQTVHARCTCPWAAHQGIACSHVLAVLDKLAELKDRKLSYWLDVDDAKRQKHRTFFLPGKGDDGVWITSRSA